jgi:hypothetical protein
VITDLSEVDLEWKPNHHANQNNPAAVLQISTRTHCLVLHVSGVFSDTRTGKNTRFNLARLLAPSQTRGTSRNHLSNHEDLIGNILRFLESERYWKCGVNIQADLMKLHTDIDLPRPPNNHLDLGQLASHHYQRTLDRYFGVKFAGLLQRLTAFEPLLISRAHLEKLNRPPYNMPRLFFFDVVHWELGHDCHDPEQGLFTVEKLSCHLERLAKLLETRVRDPKSLFSGGKNATTKPVNDYPFPADLPDVILVPMLTKMAKIGLDTLAARYLCCHLPKVRRLTMSNWELYPLTDSQLEYAALDAWIATEIIESIRSDDPQLIPCNL